MWERARQDGRESVDVASSFGAGTDPEVLGHTDEGDRRYLAGDWSGAKSAFRRALKQLSKLPRSEQAYWRARINKNLAILGYLRGDAQGWLRGWDTASSAAETMGDSLRCELLRGDMAIIRGYVLRTRGQFQEALEALDRLDLSALPNDYAAPMDAARRIEEAGIYRNIGQFDRATHLLEAVRRGRGLGAGGCRPPPGVEFDHQLMQLDHYTAVTTIEETIVRGWSDLPETDRVRQLLHVSRDLAYSFQFQGQPVKYKLAIVRADKALGWFHLLTGRTDEAARLSAMVTATAAQLGDVKSRILGATLSGAIESAQGRPEEALAAFEAAHELATTANYWKGRLMSARIAARTAYEARRFVEARDWMTRIDACAVDKWAREMVDLCLFSASAPRLVAPPDARERVRRLAAEWREATRLSSTMSDVLSHPAYLRIIALGWDAVPQVLSELERHGDPWALALQTITHTEVCAEGDAAEDVREGWLRWGREHGYL